MRTRLLHMTRQEIQSLKVGDAVFQAWLGLGHLSDVPAVIAWTVLTINRGAPIEATVANGKGDVMVVGEVWFQNKLTRHADAVKKVRSEYMSDIRALRNDIDGRRNMLRSQQRKLREFNAGLKKGSL